MFQHLSLATSMNVADVNPVTFSFRILNTRGPGSSVAIATGYGLDGPGIEVLMTLGDRNLGGILP
jgi:hypothetical protein